MRIGGLIKFSLIDYPGKVAATIFTQGCNYRCPYCHNADLVLSERFQRPIPEAEVLAFLQKRRGKLKAVVMTGGEPTLQADLPSFLAKIKDMDYQVKLDTNGSSPDVLKGLLNAGLLDYIAMDVKAPLLKYNVLTGVKADVAAVRQSMAIIAGSRVAHEFRTTAVKPLLSYEDIRQLFHLVPAASVYKLQEFVPRGNTVDGRYAHAGEDHYSWRELQDLQASRQAQSVT
jgi:pyruvate formate lyase activating enzyme